jgi:uncharacterized membrane protein
MTTPQPYASAGTPAQSDKFNVLAIIGFIASFFISIVGIVLGFIALSQIKRTGERGRGLALAAIIIGFVAIVLSIISVVVLGSIAANTDYTY